MHELVILAIVILGLPLLSFVLTISSQQVLRLRAHLIAMPLMIFGVLLAIYTAYLKLKGLRGAAIEYNFTWVSFGDVPGIGPLDLKLGIMVDNITAIMLLVVMLISALVHLYSAVYMRGDRRYARYYAFLGLFTFSMVGIVISNNLFGMYMFWELVGFSSYALISHWYERTGPQLAAKKAFIVNRIGDVAMWTGLMLIYANFRTFSFTEIFDLVSHGLPETFILFGMWPNDTLTLAGILIFCGAVGKSAQFPLHVWLPDAMEGPTPVSALIHAATMVAAGVYLTARIFPILTADASFVIACVGAVTAVIGAIIAITQTDIKRILAYSTVSQLGYMIMALGVGAFSAGLFHLVTHAMFKACLFLAAGSVIYAMIKALHQSGDHTTDAQDIRNMGGLLKRMPLTGWSFIAATLALTGIPLFSGFMSKDEILAGVTAYGELRADFALALPYIGFTVAFLTALYMGKLVFTVFFGEFRLRQIHEFIRESHVMMVAPVILLAAMSAWLWYGINPVNPAKSWFVAKWVKTPGQVIPASSAPPFGKNFKQAEIRQAVIDEDRDILEEFRATSEAERQVSSFVSPTMPHQAALAKRTQTVAWMSMLISLAVSLGGLAFAWLIYLRRPGISDAMARVLSPIHAFSRRKLFLDELYDFLITDTVLLFSRIVAWIDDHIIDKFVNLVGSIPVPLARASGWFDKYIVDGIVSLLGGIAQFFGLMIRTLQTGRIQTYLAWTLTGMIFTVLVVRFFVVGL